MWQRTIRTAIQFTKRNFSASTAGHTKRASTKKAEPEPDVEIAWNKVVYGSFLLIGWVIGPIYLNNGGLDDPPPYVPPGEPFHYNYVWAYSLNKDVKK